MKYVIERQYLLPVYQRLVVEAGSVDDACQKGVDNDDWETAEEDGDGARHTTIEHIREIPAGVVVEEGQEGAYLYDPAEDWPEAPAALPVPEQFREEP